MFLTYVNGTKQEDQSRDGVSILRYEASEVFDGKQNSAANVQMAYEQLYNVYGAGCYGCDTDRKMEHIYINNKPLSELKETSPGENFIEIEPITGQMTRMKRSYTVVLSLECYDFSTVGECSGSYGSLPFPSLKNFKNMQIPVYNITEEISIDHDALVSSIEYITFSHDRIWRWSYAFTLIAGVCCVLACCFQVIYWMNTPVQKMVDERVRKVDDAEREDELVDDNPNKPFFVL